MNRRLLATTFAALLVSIGASAAGDEAVSVSGAWVRAVPPSSTATAAYFTIHNRTDAPVRLVSGSCAIAEETEPMITTRKEVEGQNVMGMETVPSLEIPAGESLVLAPGGDHLMLMGLKFHPPENTELKIVLRFEPDAREIVVMAPILRAPPKE